MDEDIAPHIHTYTYIHTYTQIHILVGARVGGLDVIRERTHSIENTFCREHIL